MKGLDQVELPHPGTPSIQAHPEKWAARPHLGGHNRMVFNCCRDELCALPRGPAHSGVGALGPHGARVRPQEAETPGGAEVLVIYTAFPHLLSSLDEWSCRHHRDSVYAVDFAGAALSAHMGSEVTGLSGAEPESAAANRAETVEPEAHASIHPAVFATASKDHTIALWDLFADSYK